MKRRSFIVGSFLAATAAANAGSANTGGPRSCAAAKPPAPAPRSILDTDFCGVVNGKKQLFINVGTAKNFELWCDSRRVMEFANHYKPYLTDALLTGDIAGGSWNDWKDEMMAVPGFKGVLKTLGNHDIYKWNKTARNATPRECYDKYFAGIESWGVTQPGGANPDGLCYWYKDYPACGVRLIGLDCMHYDDAQQAWLVATLDDARAKKLAVVTSQHYPPSVAPCRRPWRPWTPSRRPAASSSAGSAATRTRTSAASSTARGSSSSTWARRRTSSYGATRAA